MGIVLTDIDLFNMNTAISTNFLLWALILFCCPDSGWTTQAEEMASLELKMTNIMDRMTRMEAEMLAKDERIRVLEDAVETLEKAVITKDVFTKEMETRDTQMCELEEEMASLTGRMDVTEETDVLLRGMVDQVRNPPFAFQCAWQDSWDTDNSVITYDRLTYDEISGGSIYNVTGGMDINTGVFTVGQGYAGTWEISLSFGSTQDSEEYVQAWLYINGEQIEESGSGSAYFGSEGWVASTGSRFLYMRLEPGDTLSLRVDNPGDGLYWITLCFNLAKFDDVPPM